MAEAFAQTFLWALVLLALAFIPALAMALKARRESPPARHAQPAAALE